MTRHVFNYGYVPQLHDLFLPSTSELHHHNIRTTSGRHQDDIRTATRHLQQSHMATPDVFWSIPPIQDAISIHLDTSDLRNCIQSSKALHACFIPFLWKTIDCDDAKALPLLFNSSSQSQYHHHVKSLSISIHPATDSSLLAMAVFPNLTAYTYSFFPYGDQCLTLDYLTFALRHTMLIKLDITGQSVLPNFLDIFGRTVEQAPRLKVVSIDLADGFSFQDLAAILNICSRIEDLSVYSSYDPEGYLPLASEFPRMMTNTKELLFVISEPQSLVLLSHFLQQSPLMEQLTLGSDLSNQNIVEGLSSVLCSSCPRLWDLQLSSACMLLPGIADLVQGCPPLMSMRISMPQFTLPIVQAIVSRHFGVLEQLYLTGGDGISIEELFAIAGSCRALRHLHTAVNWQLGAEWTTETLVSIKRRSWSCIGLKTIELSSRHCMPCAQHSRLAQEVLATFYQEMGRLTLLRRLDLFTCARVQSVGFRAPFMAGMDHLSGLKELRRVHISDDMDEFTVEDLKAMIGCWPRLESIDGLTGKWRGIPPTQVVSMIRAGLTIE